MEMASDDEVRWWKRFIRCAKDIPDTLEVLVGPYGELNAAERGSEIKYFNEHGDGDNVPILDLPTIFTHGIFIDNGSRL